MLKYFACFNYRSLKNIITPLGSLSVVTGQNGSGKSNLYKSLRLLSSAADNIISSLANEGGLDRIFWAAPSSLTNDMKHGRTQVQASAKKVSRLNLGFVAEQFGYSISLGLPTPPDPKNPDPSMFHLDPEIKRECIWAGDFYRPSSCLVDRKGLTVKVRSGNKWIVYTSDLNNYESILSEISDPVAIPEVHIIRKFIQGWRFYDHFRTDSESQIRIPQIGSRATVLDHDGINLVSALRTIYEIGDRVKLANSVEDAFPSITLDFHADNDNRFMLLVKQEGLIRPLKLSELSDGTLRYLALIAALLAPRPPPLLILNEPETSLHADLLPALGRLILMTSMKTQLWVVSHAPRLIETLEEHNDFYPINIYKEMSETHIAGQKLFDIPLWNWPE
ncbi:AAA family ATPase [Marinomonas sp. 2405UD68-3]|uniref:AAA family ATPase n=1 Tax=Marinomonas sp. 2405UD68-3 TaxID=3391835 RepID=UPI0039C98EBD